MHQNGYEIYTVYKMTGMTGIKKIVHDYFRVGFIVRNEGLGCSGRGLVVLLCLDKLSGRTRRGVPNAAQSKFKILCHKINVFSSCIAYKENVKDWLEVFISIAIFFDFPVKLLVFYFSLKKENMIKMRFYTKNQRGRVWQMSRIKYFFLLSLFHGTKNDIMKRRERNTNRNRKR